MVPTIAFDADDTLWVDMPRYFAQEDALVAALADRVDEARLRARLEAIELQNLEPYGYGPKGFVLSLIEAAVDATDGAVTDLGGGCGNGGETFATCARAGHADFRLRARGAIAASDAFFPFADGPTLLVEAGVTMLVHPGGSKRDDETFALCEERGVTCMVTGTRHFRH